MTNKEKLEKIVAYLIRRMYAHNQMADIGSTGDIFDEKIENAKYEECRDTLNFIDSLQEESVSEDLEEAAKNHAAERYRTTRDRELAEKCKWSFKAGAEWQKNKMMEDAIKTTIKAGTESLGIFVKGLDSNKYSFGDKVKLIIIKQEEEV